MKTTFSVMRMTVKLTILFFFFSINSHAAPIKVFNADDIFSFTRIDYVTSSPNGKQIAYVTYNRDKENKTKWRYALNLHNANDGTSEITHAENISSVSWSPDGKSIAYISQNTIFIYHLDTKTISSLVKLSQGIIGLHWSPTGKQIVFIAENDIQNPPINGLKKLPATVTNLRLYLVDLNNPAIIKPLTSADFSISYDPLTRGFSWSPDGKQIAFAYQPSAIAIDDIKPKVAILDLATQKITALNYCNTHTCRQPLYSPDGKWLAFTANIPATGKEKALLEDIDIHDNVCLRNSTDETHCLQNTFNTNPFIFSWNKENNAVYVLDRLKSQSFQIYQLNEDANTPAKLVSTQKDFIEPLTLTFNTNQNTFYFGYETVNQAPEIYQATANDFNLQQISHINKKYNLGETTVLKWQSTDGTPVEGFFIKPANYDPKHAYPLYVDVHGGPSGSQAKRFIGGCDEYGGEGMAPTTCPANILSLGYLILQVNYRGSSGYGLDFSVKPFTNFGDGEFQDIMTGIDYVTQHADIDKNNIAIAGWSNGGYLTAWALSHSDRFSIGIDGDGISDFISYAATSDDSDYGFRYFGVNFWNDHQLYWQQSPLAYVKNIHTPLLIIHGEQDIRVPLSQGKELFNTLVLLNKPVKMLIAPKQGHMPEDPETIKAELILINKTLKNTSID